MKSMNIKNKCVLLIGGAGFIGSHLAERIAEDNRVFIYDNFQNDALRYMNLSEHKNLVKIKGDVLDRVSLNKVFENDIDIVIHLAAIAGVSNVINNPLKTFEVNLMGVYNALNVANEHGVKKFINFSTSEVYGTHAKETEEDSIKLENITEPRWSYALSKISAEYLTYIFYKNYGMPTTTIRPFNIYGPRQVGKGAINIFVQDALQNKDLVISGDGKQIRAWCYIDDFVDGLMLVLESDKSAGETFNLGNPNEVYTIMEIAKKVLQITGSKSGVKFKKIDYPDIVVRVPNINKASKILKYFPSTTVDEGIRKTAEWIKEQHVKND